MNRTRDLVLLLAGAAMVLCAQPVVNEGGVLNVASYSLPGLPNSSIAQGSMFVVFGSNLGVVAGWPASLSFPLQTTMGQTSIDVTVGSTTTHAIMIYTTPGQVAAILPSSTPVGAGKLKVTVSGQASNSVDVTIVKSSFGIFTLNQAGSGPAVVQNFISQTNQPVNTLAVTAAPGQVGTIWGTGLGPVSGDEAAGPLPGDLRPAIPVNVYVGGKPANVLYAGRSGCCAGIDQVVFTVPDGLEGCYVSVVVEAGGVVSNFGSISVAANGNACSDDNGVDAAELEQISAKGDAKLGMIDLSRTELSLSVSGLTLSITSDIGTAVFGDYTASQLTAARGITQAPSVGSCTVLFFQGFNPVVADPTKPTPLDAGAALNVNGPKGAKQMPKTQTGVYSATLGGVSLDQILSGNPLPSYLDPGQFTVSGTGGSGVGAFSASVTLPDPVVWTNKDQINTIQLSQGLTVNWTGGAPGTFVSISGVGSLGGPNGPTNTTPGAVFFCVAPATAQTFTVPSYVLRALPPSPTGASAIPSSILLVGSSIPPVKFTAPGLDTGYLTHRSLVGKNVVLQ